MNRGDCKVREENVTVSLGYLTGAGINRVMEGLGSSLLTALTVRMKEAQGSRLCSPSRLTTEVTGMRRLLSRSFASKVVSS